MEYKIYELETIKLLENGEVSEKTCLSTLENYSLNGTFDTNGNAMHVIEQFTHSLKGKNLTILPVIRIDWDGEIIKP